MTKQTQLLIVGAGPAGLTAAIYARRAGKQVTLVEKNGFGGQITYSPRVENIPGFVSVSGNEFADQLVDQAISQGADFESYNIVSVSKLSDGRFEAHTEEGDILEADAVIDAVGCKHRLLGLPREEEMIGNGLSFCAVCDGAFYKNKTVALVGGGNSALVEANLLKEQVAKLYIVQNLDFLTGEKTLQDELYAASNVDVILGHTVDAYLGDDEIKGLRIKEAKSGKLRELSCDGVFLAVGMVSQNDPFKDLIPLDAQGYVPSDETCTTPVEGLFVAGDARAKRIRQVTTAAADGAVAAITACDYIDKK